jgi:hypothetical protein
MFLLWPGITIGTIGLPLRFIWKIFLPLAIENVPVQGNLSFVKRLADALL